jgi:hypothetical protein
MKITYYGQRLKINRKAFFSMEAIIGFLFLFVILSWVIIFVSKSATVNTTSQQVDLAQSHAEYVLSQLQKAPIATLAQEIQKGTWNYPNMPSISAEGMVALPNESIMTESVGSTKLQVTVTVRWQSHDGQLREKKVNMMIGG